MNDTKVMTIQDFSSFGQCSISVALPIISCLGIETIALPIGVLSTHTSEFKNYNYVDLSKSLYKSAEHINKYCKNIDWIYSGYLGNTENINNVAKIKTMYPNAKLIVDPAMAENGELYSDISQDFVDSIRQLCQQSYVCLPNLTEACMLAKLPYPDKPDKDFIDTLCLSLINNNIQHFVITGIKLDGKLVVAHQNNEQRHLYYTNEIPGKYYGCGDVFSSTLTGCMARGLDICKSIAIALDYTYKSVLSTSKDKSHWYGIKFEQNIPYLINKVKSSLATYKTKSIKDSISKL